MKINNLNPAYTFDNFIVGICNKHAYSTAIKVANNPKKASNPLFIFGDNGSGKTHLLHAIGNEIIKNNSNTKVLFTTSERFINELMNSIKENEITSFRNNYRNTDVFIMDDIQFIAGKKIGQEEFFLGYNFMYEKGTQLIFSSDRLPKDISLLEERLKSRLEWGIIADIDKPDYETRLSILRKKVQTDNIIIDDYILTVIASRVDSDIRAMEGALNKIVAYASLKCSPITIEIAEKVLNDIVS